MRQILGLFLVDYLEKDKGIRFFDSNSNQGLNLPLGESQQVTEEQEMKPVGAIRRLPSPDLFGRGIADSGVRGDLKEKGANR